MWPYPRRSPKIKHKFENEHNMATFKYLVHLNWNDVELCQLWSTKGLFILRPVVACFFDLYTRGQWCQTVWTVFVSSLLPDFIHRPPPSLCPLETEADEMGHFSPYCPVCQALLWENLTASELGLLQNCWLNPDGASEHQRPPTSSSDWACLCQTNLCRMVRWE